MRKLLSILTIGYSLATTCTVRAQSTIFTYQGRLTVNGAPANGLYDFEFTIYKIETLGRLIAGPLTNNAVGVTNGLFTTSLDFGRDPFLGVNRFLEIGVRTSGSTDPFTILAPRTRVASAPYAISAANVIDGAVTAAGLSPGPGPDGQVLKMSNGVLIWGPDLTSGGTVTSVDSGFGLTGGPITGAGTLSVNSSVIPSLNGNQTFSGSNIFTGVSSFSNASSRYVGSFVGNGAGLSNVTVIATNVAINLGGDATGPSSATVVARIRGVNVATTAPTANQVLRYSGSAWTPSLITLGTDVTGTLADARLSANVALLNNTQTFSASNTFSGVVTANNPNNRLVGTFFGNGAGLTNVPGAGNASGNLAGDVTGAATNNTVARIRGVSVSTTAPLSNQHLRYNGTSWSPGPVALSTDVSGALPVANGGTAASTPAAARANLGAAASGPNSDISSLTGLTTPLSATQGGSGQGTYNAGDMLYAPSANALGRLPVGSAGQVLSISGNVPAWAAANNHNHYGQTWSGTAADGLFLQNTSAVSGASALTGSTTAKTGLNYGVFGQSASSDGTGVEGFAFSPSGFTTGIYGEATSTNGTGVYGVGSALTGVPVGVYGEAFSPTGIGVYGLGGATSGVPVAVYGEVTAPTGYGLYTPNRLFVGGTANLNGGLMAWAGRTNLPGIAFFSATGTGLYSPNSNAVAVVTANTERLRVASDGKVGIGRIAAANTLELEGNASKTAAGSWLANSDARIKTEIQPLDHALDTVDRIRPVSFKYTDEYRAAHPSLENKKYVNVIAQEFAEVFPDAVKESGEMLDGRPILQVDVHPAAMYAIAAIRELHGQMKQKDAELNKLKEQNAALEHRLQALEQLVNRAAR